MDEKIQNIEKEIYEIKKELLEIKNLIKNSLKNNLNENLLKMRSLIKLENGFDLEDELIGERLKKNSYISDTELFKDYYMRNEYLIPLRKNGKKIQYFENEWKNDENNYIFDTIMFNIINTYLVYIQKKVEDSETEIDFKKYDKDYKTNIEYLKRLETVQKCKNQIFRNILCLIE